MPRFSAVASHTRQRVRFAAAALIVGAGAMFGAGQASAQVEIKLGHVGEPGSLFQQSADEFARLANARLAGKAKVVVYGSSQLGGDKEMLQKLKLGTLDMALPSTVMSSEVDMFGIFELLHPEAERAGVSGETDARHGTEALPELQARIPLLVPARLLHLDRTLEEPCRVDSHQHRRNDAER